MTKNIYPKIFNIFIIINLFFWDTYSGVYQQKMLFALLPFIHIILNLELANILNKKYYLNFNLEYLKKNLKSTIILFYIFIILFFHKLFFAINFNLEIEIKSILKILFLFLMIFSTFYNFEILKKNFEKIIILSFFLVSILFLIELILNYNSGIFTLNYAYLNNCYDDFFTKNSIFFMEGSHYGMVIPGLIIAYLIIIFEQKKNYLYYIPLIFLIFSTLMNALTLTFALSFIFGLGLCILFYSNFKFKIISIILIIVTLFAFINMPKCSIKAVIIANNYYSKIKGNNEYLDKYFEKYLVNIYNEKKILTITNEKKDVVNNTNQFRSSLSLAVYKNSFKILDKSFESNVFGYGIDSYKYIFKSHINETSQNLTKEPYINKIVKILNIEDASNNFVKLSLELGIFSLFIYFCLLYFLFDKKIEFKVKVFVLTLIFTQLIVRGAGYFNGGFIICLSIILISLLSKKNNEQ